VTLEAQILTVLKRPVSALSSIVIASVFSLIFLFLDQFYFTSPYFVVFVDPTRWQLLLLDIFVPALSGIVVTLSIYEIRAFPNLKGSYRKTGMTGVVAAFVAGACPCFYLGPLLAALGGVGGILGALGIFLFSYEIPIKLGSLVLLGFTGYTLERSLRAACALPATPEPGKQT